MRIFKKTWGTLLKQKLEKLWEIHTCGKFKEKSIEILSKISRKFWRNLQILEQLDVFLTIFQKQKVIETSGSKNNWNLK